jgi:tight adherence protein B
VRLRRLFLVAALVAVALPVWGASVASAGSQVKLTPLAGAHFPSRTFRLSLPPGASVAGGAFHLTENGQLVTNATVQPANALAHRFGVVLALDTSASMHGAPIRAAVTAAQAFATRRGAQQQLGLVTFNRSAQVALVPTTDPGQIQRTLTLVPQLSRGTHIFDAVSAALTVLEKAKIQNGSIVVLSDGSDVGSVATSAAVVAAAQSAGVRIFTVGLRSRSFNPTALRSLADGTGGTYSEASSPRALARIYDALGAQLANEYYVTYRSLAPAATPVQVVARVDGLRGAGTASYVTPRLSISGATFRHSLGSRFWRSPATMVIVSLLCAGLLGSGVAIAARRPQSARLRRLVGHFVALEEGHEPTGTDALTARMLDNAEQSLSRTSWWPSFKESLDIARITRRPEEIVVATLAGTVFAMWLFATALGSIVGALIGFLVPIIVRAVIRGRVARQRRLFAEQLADQLQIVASAMRAGQSLTSAMGLAIQDAPEPTRSEFQRIVSDERLGKPLEEAITAVVDRMKNSDLEKLVLVATVLRTTGGNATEVIDRVTETVRDRTELRQTIRALTAQGRIAQVVVTALPVALFLMISVINSSYIHPLLHTGLGRVLIVAGAFGVTLGSLAIKRIVEIEI